MHREAARVGLKISGCMPPIDLLEKDLPKVLEEAQVLDTKNIIVPFLPEERRKDAAGWKACAAIMNNFCGNIRIAWAKMTGMTPA